MLENKQATYEIESSEQPIAVQPFGVKLEATQKGYRIHLSTHCSTPEEARKTALQLLTDTVADLKLAGIPIAPMNGNGNSNGNGGNTA